MAMVYDVDVDDNGYSPGLDIVIVKLNTSLTCSLKNSLRTTKNQQQLLLFTLSLAIPSPAGPQLTIDQAPNPVHSLA